MVNPRSFGFLSPLFIHMCGFVPMYLGTYKEKEKDNITHNAFCFEKYPNFNVYIRFIVSILLCIYPVTSKVQQMPLIILSPPFDVIIKPFVSTDYTNNYSKCKGYSSPCLIQVYVFCCTMTSSCDSAPSFDVIIFHQYDHRLAICLH